jgi:hypothetical protein
MKRAIFFLLLAGCPAANAPPARPLPGLLVTKLPTQPTPRDLRITQEDFPPIFRISDAGAAISVLSGNPRYTAMISGIAVDGGEMKSEACALTPADYAAVKKLMETSGQNCLNQR